MPPCVVGAHTIVTQCAIDTVSAEVTITSQASNSTGTLAASKSCLLLLVQTWSYHYAHSEMLAAVAEPACERM
jgi:hypothetical protein